MAHATTIGTARRWALAGCLALAVPAAARAQALANEAGVDRSDTVVRASVGVLLPRGGMARGVVLADDGRIVTALGPLRDASALTVLDAAGRRQIADVVGRDARWGLALLQPRGAAIRAAGLSLARAARRNSRVRWTAGRERRVADGTLRARRTYVARDATLLRDAWEIDPPPADDAAGSGVADASGALVAVIVPPEPGAPAGAAQVPFGVPVERVRSLLASAPAVARRPWLGLVARDTPLGLQITTVTRDGPADRAGVRAGVGGDVIMAVDGRAVRTVADFGAALAGRQPGDTIALVVSRGGAMTELALVLDLAPSH